MPSRHQPSKDERALFTRVRERGRRSKPVRLVSKIEERHQHGIMAEQQRACSKKRKKKEGIMMKA
eukprot:CAMPEP_0178718032 /NCGR_PEP_ID=MMETSP0699-20121125/22290_1 /TAXON_ID=265572 /ORGANISM="Extubocellulus spinifer, Strain CCMP396" /LENGTH=64 /DNA_ID=CAMNT_0020368005 /DNA_START=267 /DNA_END=461 /DNA_ORIENTATION=+